MIHLVMQLVIVFMYTHLGVASGDSSRHLRLFLCIDMLVCLQAIRRETNAETSVIHVVMPPVVVFMSTHLGVASGDWSSHKCRDLSDSPRHASSILLRGA